MTSERAVERSSAWGAAGLYALAGLSGLGLGFYDGPRFWDNGASNLGEVAFGVAMLAAAALSVRLRESQLGEGLPAVIALSGAVALFVGLQVGSTAQGRPMFERGTIVTLVGALVFQCAVALFVRWRARRSVR